MRYMKEHRETRDTIALLIVFACLLFLLVLFPSCTPWEREVTEEVVHEAYIAEQAIAKDLSTPQSP